MRMGRPLLFLLFAVSIAVPAAEISVSASRDGDALVVSATAEIEADLPVAWQVLTDYGRIADYVPSLRSSRVVSRGRNSAVVEQLGEARLLFLSFPLKVTLAVTEHPFESVESRAVGGNFREMQNRYVLAARQNRIVMRYAGRLVPDFDVPALIGVWLLESSVDEAFRALVGEIEREQAKRRRQP